MSVISKTQCFKTHFIYTTCEKISYCECKMEEYLISIFLSLEQQQITVPHSSLCYPRTASLTLPWRKICIDGIQWNFSVQLVER